MKKLLVLAAALSMGLTACGGSDEATTAVESDTAASTAMASQADTAGAPAADENATTA